MKITRGSKWSNGKIGVVLAILLCTILVYLVLININASLSLNKKISKLLESPNPSPVLTAADGDGCYLRLQINESMEENITTFSLINQSVLYGDYRSSLDPYFSDQNRSYLFRTYDSLGHILDTRALFTARAIIKEARNENDSSVVLLDEAIITVIIPYIPEISNATILFNGTVTDLNLSRSLLRCTRTCKLNGEHGTWGKDNCCSDLQPHDIDGKSFVCTICRYQDGKSQPAGMPVFGDECRICDGNGGTLNKAEGTSCTTVYNEAGRCAQGVCLP